MDPLRQLDLRDNMAAGGRGRHVGSMSVGLTSDLPACAVVHEHCNVARNDFDGLKAILFNCVRHGPAGQNREDVGDFRRHLDGRVNWVEHVNPARGAQLRALFERIAWE
jgi:hypothetical protein